MTFERGGNNFKNKITALFSSIMREFIGEKIYDFIWGNTGRFQPFYRPRRPLGRVEV
jgi:hypothetical protein